jgi:hypothetical protein
MSWVQAPFSDAPDPTRHSSRGKRIMPVLVHPIPKQDWLKEVKSRNGVSPASQGEHPKDTVQDAGSWEPAVQKIVGFQHLGDDWDGFGALAPTREVLESAIGLAHCFLDDGVDPPHRVVAGPGGEVVFEWQDPDGTYTEVEIDLPLHAEVMVVEPGKPARQWTLPTE